MAIKILNGIDVVGSMNITASDIPSLDANKITTGTLAAGLIPSLDASKIGSGTLSASRIPNLDGSKITTGTIAAARIGDLSSTYATVSSVPTNVSELTNDIGYLSSLPSHNHDDRYYTETEIDGITHQWEWKWQRWTSYLSPAADTTEAWTTYYKTYFTERTEAIDTTYPLQGSGYVNTITNVGNDGGFGGSTYGNIFGDLASYHCHIYTNIYVDKEFTVNITNFNGDDPHAIFIDGKFVHGRIPCCTDTAYNYTFKQGWHRIDLIYSEGGGGDWIRMGWNPKNYLANISDMTPHRGGENPNYILDKLNALGTLATESYVTTRGYITGVSWNDVTSKPTLDNYVSWNLKTNSVQRTAVGSGADLNLVAGTNVSIGYSAGGTVTISSTDTNTTYSVGDGGLTQKNFTTTLKTKLDGIEAGANVTDTANVVAALTAGNNVSIAANGTISATNTDTVTSVGVSGSETAGTITLTAAGATTLSQSGQTIEIRSTNTEYTVGDGGLTEKNFTTALKTKLDGIEAGATADQTPMQILTAIKTVDGSGSGLDADTLDGNQATAFATAAQGTKADAALPRAGGTVTGNIVIDQDGDNGAIVYTYPGGVYVPKPNGASFATTSSSQTGAIAIKLPTTSWNRSDMISFNVDIYDYNGNNEGESVSLYVYGYQYSTGLWTNQGAVILSDRTDRDYTVRFGHDGTRHIVYIGETTSTWNYLQVTVRDFQAGYDAGVAGNYDNGWEIAVSQTSFSNLQKTSSDNYPVAKQFKTARNIALSGAVTGNANFDGSGNITIATTATADPTLTLSGDASGSATFTNLGNATLTVTVANDSHTHDGRYYTETEIDTLLGGYSATSHVHSVATTSANGFMSSTDKTKLDGIEAGADVTDAINVSAAGAMLKAGIEKSTAMKEFETTISYQDDWQNSPIAIRERGAVGVSQSDDRYSPNLCFHWGGRSSNSLWMNSGGQLNYGSYNNLGVPAADGTFKAGTLYAGAESITATKVGQWNTAYGWGNHASVGYLTAVPSGYATETYVGTQISNLVSSAPSTLDTLNELAAALGDDPNFATTVTNSIATKLPFQTYNSGTDLNTINRSTFGAISTGNASPNTNQNYSAVYSLGVAGIPNTLQLGTASDYNASGLWVRQYNQNAASPQGTGWQNWTKVWTDNDFANNSANWNTAYADRYKWNGGSSGLNAATGRTSLGLGTAATSNTGDFATAAQGTKADTAFGWGNHASAGYLTSYTETDTLASVTSRGASTTTSLSIRNLTSRTIVPETNVAYDLGTPEARWQIVFCQTLDSAGQHESQLQNPEGEKSVGDYATGTVLVWKGGKNIPCTEAADHMRMGIAVNGIDSPLVQGAEPVLVTGSVNEGDYLVTSSVEGHAKAITPQFMRQHMLFDCVIGKALESGEGDSHLIKTWINI